MKTNQNITALGGIISSLGSNGNLQTYILLHIKINNNNINDHNVYLLYLNLQHLIYLPYYKLIRPICDPCIRNRGIVSILIQ